MKVESPVVIATIGATALMASQVAAKAVRDAFFLSHFGVGALPVVVIAAALISIIASVATARMHRSLLPTGSLPHIFVGSSGLLLVSWGISNWNPVLAAVLIYLQITVLGSMLISGFWSLLDDRFDPRSAKRQFGKIVAAGTLGGVVGGLLAAMAGSSLGVAAILPGLAALHLLCAIVVAKLISARQPGVTRTGRSTTKVESGLIVVRTVPYVRNLAQLILTSTMGAVLLDYVFKARAAGAYPDGQELMRFFALFYTVVGVITFLVQLILNRVAVERLGVAGTVSSLPVSLTLGSLGAILLPGLGAAFAMRGGEAMIRSSLFKSSYEMLYSAVPRRERQATKSLLDVGVERFGDLLGALLLGSISWLSSESMTAMLAASAVLGLSGFVASRRLREGYVQALENNLMNRTVVMEHLSQVSGVGVDVTRTLANVTIGPSSSLAANESIAQQTLALRASDPDSVRDALSMPLDFAVAPYVIRLLAWDLVAPDALRALRRMGPRLTEQLVSVLLNPEEEFAVRRRVPRVLGELGTQSAVNGLIEGLAADRFEVRFRCAQALAKIKMRNSKVIIDADNITKAVERELAGNSVPEPVGMITMDHVFRLLALVYPCKPLYAAHRGLESQDLHFRRTSLEYLENVLPAPVWQRIVPAFEEGVSLAVAG